MTRKKKKRVTLTQIADLSGVSQPTVSAILGNCKGNNTRFSQKTYERVMKVAEELNYRPNRTSRLFKEERHGALAVLATDLHIIPTDCLDTLASIARDNDQVVTIENRPEKGAPICVKEDAVDGIISFENIPNEFLEDCDRYKIPLVCVNNNIRHKPYSITYNEEGAVSEAVHYLAKRGRKSLAYVQGGDWVEGVNYWDDARISTMKKASQELGLQEPQVFRFHPFRFYPDRIGLPRERNHQAIVERAVSYFQKHPEVDAVICSNAILASYIYKAARECGKSIPEDLALITMHEEEMNFSLEPPASCLVLDHRQVGKEAALLLNRIIDEEDLPTEPTVIDYKFIEMGSSL